MSINPSDIIAENTRRLAYVNAQYDPQKGTQYCNEIQRVPIRVEDAPFIEMNIPVEMENEPVVKLLQQEKSLAKACKRIWGAASETQQISLWRYFHKVRCKYDFEYWCCTQIRIKYKGKGKRDPFILNRAQRYYLSVLERLRKAGVPIYIILLKARQWGGSTMTQFYMMWIQKMHKMHWNSVIVGDVEKQSKVVLAMYEQACQEYDTFIDEGVPTVLKPYGRTNDVRLLEDRGCTISIGSMQKPNKIRSEDISMAHLTEVGIWKETEGKSPEDVIQSIEGSILPGAYTMLVEESTAKGVGNYFHNTYTAAKAGDNNFTPVFIPWFMIDIYSKKISLFNTSTTDEEYREFIASMTEYEWSLWQLGATLEAINWYRTKSRGMDEWRMKSEFPSTDIEAFQSTGRGYFKDEYLEECYQSCRQPKIVGEIVSSASSLNKTQYLQNLRIEPNSKGNLKVWADVDKSVDMHDRYVVCVDLGKGATDAADSTIACIFDRYWQQEGEDGYPEVVAEWSGKESETDLLAWRIAQIAAYYNNALLVIESNTIDSSKESRFRAVLDEIKDYYPNIYKRSIANKTDVGTTGGFRYGWNTNHQSKEEICADLGWALREGMYVERCREAVDEMKIFERKADGSLGNVEGKHNHDDRVITRALGVHFCYKKMPAPRVNKATDVHTVTNTIINDMSI